MKKIIALLISLIMLVMSVSAPVSAQAAQKPAATKVISLTSTTNSFTLKWAKKKVQGYQIFYSTKSDFDNAKSIFIKKAGTTSKTVKKLKSGKKYYVKVRTYKTVNGKKKFSKCTKKKAITIKTKSSSKKKSSAKKSSSGTKTGENVYITPTGKRYHYDPDCGGVNSYKVSLSHAEGLGLSPCQKCAS